MIDSRKLNKFLKDFTQSKKKHGCYVQEIKEFDFLLSIDNLHHNHITLFYWKSSTVRFLSIGQNFKETHEKPSFKPLERLLHDYDVYRKDSYQKIIPLFIGANAFCETSHPWNDFSSSEWFVPYVLLTKLNDTTLIALNFSKHQKDKDLAYINTLLDYLEDKIPRIYPKNFCTKTASSTFPSKSKKAWKQDIDNTLNKIKQGYLTKIVLSRFKMVPLLTKFSLSKLLKYLSHNSDGQYIFCFAKRSSAFWGLSPEMLLTIQNRQVFTEALAGTASLELKEKLSTLKNKREQKIVEDFVIKNVLKFCDTLSYQSDPYIKELLDMCHLSTRISALLRQNASPFDLASSLHPTPAVCGIPVKTAYKEVSNLETLPRGLYSGSIGWANFDASHLELSVAIRSSLIKDQNAFVFAGCGILQGSNSEAEFQESELKINSIIKMLKHGF